MNVVTESGLYHLVFTSRKPEAKEVIGTVWGRGYTVRNQVPQPTPSVMLGRLMPTMPEQTLAMLPCATSAMNAVALGA